MAVKKYLVYTAVIPVKDDDRSIDSYFKGVPYNAHHAFMELPHNTDTDAVGRALDDAVNAHIKKMKKDGLPGRGTL